VARWAAKSVVWLAVVLDPIAGAGGRLQIGVGRTIALAAKTEVVAGYALLDLPLGLSFLPPPSLCYAGTE